jgi:hypothetical protein
VDETRLDDDEAKKRVQEAAWTMIIRGATLAVVFGFGFFAGWLMWGVGDNGAPALRQLKVAQEAEILERKNKMVDVEGRLEVATGKLSTCSTQLNKANGDLAKAKVELQKLGAPAQ